MYLKPSYAKQLERGKELYRFFLPNTSDDFCFCFCLYPSSMDRHLWDLTPDIPRDRRRLVQYRRWFSSYTTTSSVTIYIQYIGAGYCWSSRILVHAWRVCALLLEAEFLDARTHKEGIFWGKISLWQKFACEDNYFPRLKGIVSQILEGRKGFLGMQNRSLFIKSLQA